MRRLSGGGRRRTVLCLAAATLAMCLMVYAYAGLAVHNSDATTSVPVIPRESVPATLAASAATTTTAVRSKRWGTPAVKGVILFLYGGRWHSYFVRECLPRLERYFLLCHNYPVHVFHEGMTGDSKQGIRAVVPSASSVDFEDVSAFWKTLPHGVSEAQLQAWMRDGVQHKFQGRGYRLMCRFWAGLVWTLPSMDKYEYYWRLDTDSIITRPIARDPFVVMRERGCEYGFNRLKGENPHVLTQLWETYLKWAKAYAVNASTLRYVTSFAVNGAGQFWGPMYYNNFELGTFAMKRSSAYQSMFRFLDEQPPLGFLRFRWGDAPVHTLGVATVLAGRRMCNFTQEMVGYRHAAMRPEPMTSESCSPHPP